MEIYSQNIYEIVENGLKKYVLIIYNISGNHYVGLTIHNTESNNLLFIKSINKFVDIEDLKEYNKSNIKRIGLYKRKIFNSH